MRTKEIEREWNQEKDFLKRLIFFLLEDLFLLMCLRMYSGRDIKSEKTALVSC